MSHVHATGTPCPKRDFYRNADDDVNACRPLHGDRD